MDGRKEGHLGIRDRRLVTSVPLCGTEKSSKLESAIQFREKKYNSKCFKGAGSRFAVPGVRRECLARRFLIRIYRLKVFKGIFRIAGSV